MKRNQMLMSHRKSLPKRWNSLCLTKTADVKAAEPVAMAEVKLPGSSMEVTAVAQDDNQSVGKTLAAGPSAGNNNIISLAQRIRALHSDAPGNS